MPWASGSVVAAEVMRQSKLVIFSFRLLTSAATANRIVLAKECSQVAAIDPSLESEPWLRQIRSSHLVT